MYIYRYKIRSIIQQSRDYKFISQMFNPVINFYFLWNSWIKITFLALLNRNNSSIFFISETSMWALIFFIIVMPVESGNLLSWSNAYTNLFLNICLLLIKKEKLF